MRGRAIGTVQKTVFFGAICAIFAGTACRDMYDQTKVETFEASGIFEDGLSARPVVQGTVARGQLKNDALLDTGKIGGVDADLFPYAVTKEALVRGRARYDIFCSPCHDRAGYGRGLVVLRGFKGPPSFHQDRLRRAPVGHFYDAIKNGFGAMYGYGARIPVADRWAIVAYVRALQLSQNATLADVPSEHQALFAKGVP